MKNKWLALHVMIILFVTVFSTPVLCLSPVSVVLNGEKIMFDVDPIIIDDRTLVPMRAVFEALGAVVSYDEQTKMITATKTAEMAGTREIILTAGSRNAMVTVNGVAEEYLLDVEPREIGGRILLPVRFIGEALCADVRWDSIKRQVLIYTSDSLWTDNIDPWNDLEAYQAAYVVNQYLALLQGAVWGGALYEYHPMLFSQRVREAPEPWALVWQPSMAGMVGTSVCRLNFCLLSGHIIGEDEHGKHIYEMAARVWSYDPRAGEPAFTDWIKAYRVICEDYMMDGGGIASHWVIDGERIIRETRIHSDEMPDFWLIE